MEETMSHPIRDEWLSALKLLGPGRGVAPDNYGLKSPTFTLGNWRLSVEHQRNFESVVVQWIGFDGRMPAPPQRWITCPPSDRQKGWQYRVIIRPEKLVSLLDELRGELQNIDDINRIFDERVSRATSDTSATRRARLLTRAGQPLKILVMATVFDRDPDVVAEVIFRANGICQKCHQPAPFIRRKNGVPYLEVHHVVHLADGGDDTVENAVAICPNCHRKIHYG